MAIIYRADLTPSKLDLIGAWLATRQWYPDDEVTGLDGVSAARFDDPDGQVGIEIVLVRTPDGPLIQVPMTYRAAPLEGAERWLIGTTDHSVLGTRWVYDAVGDPVFVAALTAAIRTGGSEAREYVQMPEGPVERKPKMRLRGSGRQPAGTTAEIVRVDDGDPAVILTHVGELSVLRLPTGEPPDTQLTLEGSWGDESVTLALLT